MSSSPKKKLTTQWNTCRNNHSSARHSLKAGGSPAGLKRTSPLSHDEAEDSRSCFFGCSCNCGAELRTDVDQRSCCCFGVIAQIEHGFGLRALIGLFSGFNKNRLDSGPLRGTHGEDARAGDIRLGSRNVLPHPAGKLTDSVTGLAGFTEPFVNLHPDGPIGGQEPQNLGVSESQFIHPLLAGSIIGNFRGESPENRGGTGKNQADVDTVFIVRFGPQIKQPSRTHGPGSRRCRTAQPRGRFKIKLSPHTHVGTRTADEAQHNRG